MKTLANYVCYWYLLTIVWLITLFVEYLYILCKWKGKFVSITLLQLPLTESQYYQHIAQFSSEELQAKTITTNYSEISNISLLK